MLGLVPGLGLPVDCNEPHISTEEICLMSDWGQGTWALGRPGRGGEEEYGEIMQFREDDN